MTAPLAYRDKGTSGTQLEALSGTVPIGRVSKQKFSITAGGAEYWDWHFALTAGLPGHRLGGRADDMAGAKAALEATWRDWLAAAALGPAQ